MTAVLQVDSVSKRFRDVQAVDGVSLQVQAGEVFGLLGPNGAGKTTLIRMILDIYRPDTGSVAVFGHKMSRRDLDDIGYLPEERGLYRRRKVIQVLDYLGRLKGLSHAEAVAEGERWLEKLDIAEYRNKKLEALSKGNQQKIQLIGTLIGRPKLLVWDEPFSGLDPVNVSKVREMLAEQREAGTTVILSTHLMNQAEALCDRVGLIHGGHLVLDGPTDEVRAQHGSDAWVVETDGDVRGDGVVVDRSTTLASGLTRHTVRLDAVEPLLARLLDHGATVRSVQPMHPTLEEVFLRAVG